MKRSSKMAFLVDGQAAGGYTLPEEITTADATLRRLVAHTIPQPKVTDPVAEAARLLLAAARDGRKLLTRVDGLQQAEPAAAAAAQTALNQAIAEAIADLEVIGSDLADVVIADHLAPVYAEIVREARKVGPVAASLTDPVEVARADQGTRDAIGRFAELVGQYATVRDVWSRLLPYSGEQQHPSLTQFYSEIRDPQAAWPAFSSLSHQVRAGARAPWQEGSTRDRLSWLVLNPAADVWMPTVEQLNALVWERHSVELSNQDHAMSRVRAQKAWAA